MNQPTFDHYQHAREQMIRTQLVRRGIHDERVLDAMRTVPRELFVPPAAEWRAYEDCALPISCSQTISQPYMVASMTELLELKPGDRVLEVGTGSGYQAAVLAQLAERVYTIERHPRLLEAARTLLVRQLGYANIRFRCGDGTRGWRRAGPFDAIVVTAGGPRVPPALATQLSPNGRLIVPVGARDQQTLVRVRRLAHGFEQHSLYGCRFVQLCGEDGW